MSNEHSSNDHTVQFDPLMGGGVRVNFFPKQEGDSQDHAERMVKASERVQIREGGANSHMAVTVSGEAEFAGNGTILRATSESGMPMQGSRITEDSFVRLLDVPVRIKDAVSMGLVVKDPSGSFRVVSAAGAAGTEGTQSGK